MTTREDMSICDVLRASHVTRWHMVGTLRHQSLAEHLFNTAMMVRYLGAKLEMPNLPSMVLEALVHDIEEVYTGDIPTPTKDRLQAIGCTSKSIRPIDTHLHMPVTPHEAAVIKVCDLLDAYIFIKKNKIDKHGKIAMKGIENALVEHLCHFEDEEYDIVVGFIEEVMSEKKVKSW